MIFATHSHGRSTQGTNNDGFKCILWAFGTRVIGWVGMGPKHFPFTAYNPSVKHIRHAVAIDKRRALFAEFVSTGARTRRP